MSATIVSRTISAVIDKKLVLANDEAARLISLGTTWTKIRFGMRLMIDPQGLTSLLSAPVLKIGMCSGTANKVGDATTTNFFGFSLNGDLAYNAASGGNPAYLYNAGANTTSSVKKVGTTITNGPNTSAWGLVNDTAYRTGFVIQIEKGSPNYTCSVVTAGGAGLYKDLSYSGLIQGMEAATTIGAGSAMSADVGGTGYTNISVVQAFDEVAGGLDTFNIQWSIASRPLEVSEVLYARIA